MRMMRLLYVVVWSLLLVSPTASLRAASQHEEEEEEQERLHPIRRIYDNAHVRREVARLEERIERYQTGLPANPDHVVPYKNHPFDRSQQRQLQENATVTDDDGAGVEEGDDDTPATMPTSNQQSLFQPMRIKFFTEALDSIQDDSNAAKIEWYKREILPKTAEFWSSALAVVPVDGNLKIDAGELDSRLYCGDSAFTQVPDSHSSQGVSDADLILYVSGSNDSRFCPERTLAVAVPCNFDQFDRPTAGAINVCLDNIVLRDDGSASNGVTQDYVDVTIHEVGHVLGMSSNSYRFFWDPTTGKPRTERPFTARSVVCVNGAERSLILPAENTMVFVDDASGNRYASIVTEKVRTVARNQFDCQSLEGGRLENQPTREDSCTGDHWDERLFYPEALSGVISPTANVFSSLTLALMEDSGWYQANYTVTRMSPWGLGVGCSFVEDPCLVASSEGTTIPEYSQGYFCVSENEKSCSSEHTHKMACTIVDYAYYVPQDLPVEQYQYFPDAPSKGGPRQANFCPVFGSPYNSKTAEELDCRDPDNLSSFNVYR